jgi:diguanylate cyclase (GGDEF)-like protein/PAS domain S-box-containing protein
MVVQGTEVVGWAAYRVLFDHSADGVLFSAPDGRITAANPAACAMLDMPAEEIGRLGRDGLIDGEDPRWVIALAEQERTGSSDGVARLRRGDGHFVELETSTRIFHDEEGSVRILTLLRDITSRVAIEREIEELSARLLQLSRGDELTGLQNHRGLLVSGTRLLQFADHRHADVHALFVDVDNVEELNGRHGHLAGDAALAAVARALSVAFGTSDVLARIAGTAFLVLATDLSEADRAAAVRRIRRHLVAPETMAIVGAAVEVSFGWTTRPAGDPSSLEELVARSDRARHEAREVWRAAGRSRSGSV